MASYQLVVLYLLYSALTCIVYGRECDFGIYGKSFSNVLPNCGTGQCYCEGNIAKCVGDGIMNNIPKLDDSVDRITEIHVRCYNFSIFTRDSLRNISSLNVNEIHIGRNEIQNVSADVFADLRNISAVVISDNSDADFSQVFEALGNIPYHLQVNVTLKNMGITSEIISSNLYHIENLNLTLLSLASNNIDVFNIGVFSNLTLRILDLSHNWIGLTTGHVECSSLEELNLAANNLHMENLHFCKANSTSEESMFPNLRTLNLKHNIIGSNGLNFTKTWRCLDSVEHLDLSNNTIKEMNISLLAHMTSLKVLLLFSNWIQTFIPGNFPPQLERIDFRDNQFTVFPPKLCKDSSTEYPNLTNLNFSRNYIQRIITDNWNQCLPNLTVLDFSKNDVREIRNNTFATFTKLKELYLDNMIPWLKNIQPMALNSTSVEVLSLRFNWIDFTMRENQRIFKACPNVKKLDISYNYFRNITEDIITNTILAPMSNLRELRAQRISLLKFPYTFLQKFKQLRYLDVDRNLLSTVQFPVDFDTPNLNITLETLSVAEGDINSIDEDAFPQSILKSLKKLNLGGNEFACNCAMKWFRNRINNGKIEYGNNVIELIGWPNNYLCRSPPKENMKLFKDYNPEKDCPLDPFIVGCITALCSLLVFTVLVATGYWNRWYLQYWWYKITHRSKRTSQNPERLPLLSSYKYDGYVVYNEGDDDFVHHPFLDFFEKDLNYRLHVWKRDAASGALIDVILDAIYASRHVVVIISNNLLKDPWCKFQVDVAIDRSIEVGRNFVLLVVLEEVDLRYVSKAWCVLLTKTPSAYWSNSNDIKQKLLEQTVKSQFQDIRTVQ